MNKPRLSRLLLLTGLVFLAVMAIESRFARYDPNWSDEGLVVEGAHQFLQGIYQPDVFAHYSSRYMIEGILLRVCGDKLMTLRLFWAILRALTAAMLFWLVAVLACSATAWPMVLLYLIAPGPWHKSWLSFLTLFIAVLFLVYRRRPNRGTALALGAGVGLAFAIHPYTGVLAGIACLLALPRAVPVEGGFRRAASMLILGATGVALTLGYWVWQVHAWSDFLPRHLAVLRGDYIGFREFFYVLATGRHLDQLMPATIFDVMLILGVGALILSFRRPAWLDPGPAADLRGIALLALFSLPKVLARNDLSHLLQNLPPFLALAGLLLGWTRPRLKRSLPRLAFGMLAGWLVVFAIWFTTKPESDYYIGSPSLLLTRHEKINNDFAPMYARPFIRGLIERSVAQLQQLAPNPDDPIFVAPFAPLFYALADRPNVVPLALFDRPENLRGYSEAQIMNDLLARPPRAVLLEDVVTDGNPRNKLENILPNVMAWIADHCEKRGAPGAAFIIYACE